MTSNSPIYALLILVMITSSCIVEKEDKREQYQAELLAKASIIPGATIGESTIEQVIGADIGFSTLQSIVEATQFLDTFDTTKPFTIFAPVNTAFGKLHKATIDQLLKVGDHQQLRQLLNSHIIPNQINAADITKEIENRKGSVKLTTLGGTTLIATMKRGAIYLIDNQGNSGKLITTDVKTATGYIHTLDGVMMPK